MLEIQSLWCPFVLAIQDLIGSALSKIAMRKVGLSHLLACSSKISFGYPHPSLPQSKKPGLRAHSLDIGTRHVVLRSDELFEVDIFAKTHTRGMQPKTPPVSGWLIQHDTRCDSPEYVTLRLDVREGEFDFAIDTTRSDQSRVERFDLVCGHDDLDVTAGVKAIKLVEEFQHGSLDLAFTTG